MTTTMRTDTWLNTISIDGGPALVFDTFKGGDNDSTVQTYRPGGMAPAKTIGGQSTFSPITMDKSMEQETDWTLIAQLMRARVGAAQAIVSRQPLDANGAPFGRPLIYSGILKQVILGDTDSNKADAQLWSVVVVPGGTLG